MFVVDLKTEVIAVQEAKRLRIPIIGLVDTNCDPDGIDYVIPGNDDAIKSCAIITQAIGDVVSQGFQTFRAEEERARKEAEEKARKEAEERAPRARRRSASARRPRRPPRARPSATRRRPPLWPRRRGPLRPRRPKPLRPLQAAESRTGRARCGGAPLRRPKTAAGRRSGG